MKKGSVGIVIGVIVAILLIGGAYYLGIKKEQISSSTTTSPQKSLTVENILNSNGFVDGYIHDAAAGGSTSLDKNKIIFGDLDGDGINEAVDLSGFAGDGASGGNEIVVFKLLDGKVIMGDIPGTEVEGAAQTINSFKIEEGKVIVTETDSGGTHTTNYKVKFVDGKLVAAADQTTKSTPTLSNQSSGLTVEKILNSNGFVNGMRSDSAHSGTMIVKESLVFGDVDGDGVVDAVGHLNYCAGSCGDAVDVFKLSGGKVIMAEIPGTAVAGAAKEIDAIKINNGGIIVTEGDFDGIRTTTYYVRFINGELRIKDPITGLYVSQDPKNAQFTFISPAGGEHYKVGQTITIKWAAPGLASDAYVSLMMQKGNDSYSTVGESTNGGTFTWTIPSSLSSGYTSLTDTNTPTYRIGITFDHKGLPVFNSQRFSITQ